MLLSATAVQARTSTLQSPADALNARACIALKYSALPDRYYDCVRQALAFNEAAENGDTILVAANTSSDSSFTDVPVPGAASIETPTVTLLLAQNTTTDVINNGVPQAPRVISRPQSQSAAEEAANAESVAAQTTDSPAKAQTDVLPAWLPEPAKAWLGSVLSEEQLALLGRNWLYGLLAIGAMILLPLLLSLISRARRRRRYGQGNIYAAADTSQTAPVFDDLDFGDLDMPADDAKKADSQVQNKNSQKKDNEESEESEKDKRQPSPVAEDTQPEQKEAKAGSDKDIVDSIDEDNSEHDETTLLTESVEPAQAALKQQTAEEQQQVKAANPANSPTVQPGNLSNGAAADSLISESDSHMQPPPERRPLTRFGSWLYELPPISGKPASMEAVSYTHLTLPTICSV